MKSLLNIIYKDECNPLVSIKHFSTWNTLKKRHIFVFNVNFNFISNAFHLKIRENTLKPKQKSNTNCTNNVWDSKIKFDQFKSNQTKTYKITLFKKIS